VPRRLLIRPGAIGDTILSLPALENLITGETEIWAPSQNLPLLSHLAPVRPLIDTGIDSLTLGNATLARLGSFDEIISWYGANRDGFRDQVKHLPFRFLTALPPPDCPVHAVDFYLNQVGATPGAIPRLPVARSDEGFAVIHPFSGSPKKNWPIENFRAVAQFLPMPVHWCAGPDDLLDGAMRFDTLAGLIPWLSHARLFIGNDSGIAHLAAACGVPVIAIFGPTDPRIWSPRGPSVRIFPWDTPPSRIDWGQRP